MYVRVRVTPNAKKESVIQKDKEHFEILVREKAERNLANKRVIELIARIHNVSVGSVKIISGHHSPSKILSVEIER